MRNSLAPIILAASLALVLGVWLTQRGPRVDPAVAPPTVAPAIAMPETASNLAEPLRAAVEQRAELEAQPAEVAPTPPRARERADRVLESSDEKETGSIHVTVVSPLGEPVPGAEVRVIRVPTVQPALPFRGPKTDSRGHATISSVGLGAVRVTTRPENLAPGISETVWLTVARPTAEVVITLTLGGSVVGEVMDIHGEPAAGTRVTIHLRAWPGQVSRSVTSYMQATNAGDDGSFRFDHLAPGDYMLHRRAEASKRKIVPDRMLELRVLEGQTTKAVFEGLLGAHVQLSCLVLRDGEPVAGATVKIHWGDRERDYLGRKAKTDAEGHFEVTLDEAAEYQFQISDPLLGHSIFRRATVPAVPLHELVIAYDTGRISGRVLGPGGRPAAGVVIMALGRHAETGAGSTVADATSDENGDYEFPQLLTATYEIMAGRNHFPHAPQAQANPFMGGAQVSGLRLWPGENLTVADLHLPAAAAIEVVVTDREGNRVATAEVQCARPENTIHHEMVTGQSDATGLCRIDGVAPGDFRIRAIWEREISPWAQVSMIANETARAALVVEPGTMVTIEVQDGGAPVKRCYINIKDAGGFIVTGSVLKDGSSTLGPLAPGTYKVEAHMRSAGAQAEQAITVAGEPSQTVQLTLQ